MDSTSPLRLDLAAKIARLVEERGWNQEDFARIANLNRHTVREIIKNGGDRRLRNATVGQCATALGLHVNELREIPLERLLPRMHGKTLSHEEGGLKLIRERATSPDLLSWIEKNAERAQQITPDEAEDLLTMQGADGAIDKMGMDLCMELIERKRRLLRRVAVIASTEHLDFLEEFVSLLFEKVQSNK